MTKDPNEVTPRLCPAGSTWGVLELGTDNLGLVDNFPPHHPPPFFLQEGRFLVWSSISSSHMYLCSAWLLDIHTHSWVICISGVSSFIWEHPRNIPAMHRSRETESSETKISVSNDCPPPPHHHHELTEPFQGARHCAVNSVLQMGTLGRWRGWKMEKYLAQGQTANSSTDPVCTTSQWSKRLWDLRAQSGGNYKPFLYSTFISLKGLRRRNSTNSGEQIPRCKYQLHHLWFGGGMTLG